MLGIERKPFKAIELIDFERANKQVRIEEGMNIKIDLCEVDESMEGKVVKIQSKAFLIHIEGEIGNREIEFVEIESIRDLDSDPEDDE